MSFEGSVKVKVLENTMQEENMAYCCEWLHCHTLYRSYLQHDVVVCQVQQLMNLRILGPSPGRCCPRRAVSLFLTGCTSCGWTQMETCNLFPSWKVAVFLPWGWVNGQGRLDTGWETCACSLQRDHICSACVTVGWWSFTHFFTPNRGLTWATWHAGTSLR